MKFLIFKYFFAICMFSSIIYADGHSYSKQGSFKSWTVYTKANKDICYMISYPEKSVGKYNLRGRVSVIIARRPKEDNKNFIGIDFGYSFKKNAKVKLVVDKKQSFSLHTFQQTAWTKPSKSSKRDDVIIEGLLKGKELVVYGRSKRGTDTEDYYSLIGFSKAYNKIKEVCG